MKNKQKTIAKTVSLSGVGIHTGQTSTVTFHPAGVDFGLRLAKAHELQNHFKPDSSLVTDTSRGTTLTHGQETFNTVEHILSALQGLGIDNCLVALSAEEPPIMDGSALPFIEALEAAGLVEQDKEQTLVYRIDTPFVFQEGDKSIVGWPHDGLRITYNMDYPNTWLSKRRLTMDIEPEHFKASLGFARTFCFEHEIEWLKAHGLAKGGTADNALVLTTTGVKNGPLRHEDELVLHKILDLVGDLTLLGVKVRGHFVATKTGHGMNVKLVDFLKSRINRQQGGRDKVIIEAKDIEQLLPHRYPFLLVDRVIDLVEGEKVVGLKNVTMNEHFFQGHFPGHPIMPGVLIVEAMAQCGGVLLMKSVPDPKAKVVYFISIDNVKFRKPVVPGDQLRFELTVGKIKSKIAKMHGQAFVEDKLVCEADLMCTLMDR